MLTRPDLYQRDCKKCWQFFYHEKGEKRGQVQMRHGKPMKRPKGTGPNCTYPIGCPKGHIDRQRVLTSRNRRVYQHFCECRAVGSFPDDPIVRKNAAIIWQCEKRVDRMSLDQLHEVIQIMVARHL